MPALSACAVHDPRSLRPWLQVLLWLALMGYAAIWLLGTWVVFAFLLGVTFMLSAAFFGPIAAAVFTISACGIAAAVVYAYSTLQSP